MRKIIAVLYAFFPLWAALFSDPCQRVFDTAPRKSTDRQLFRIVREFQRRGISFALAGGYAMRIHGALRKPSDIDIIIQHSRSGFESVEKCLRSMGFMPFPDVSGGEFFDFKKQFRYRDRLWSWGFSSTTPPFEFLDVLFAFNLASVDTTEVTIGGMDVRVVTLRELIRIKETSMRTKDHDDVLLLRKLEKKLF